MKILIIDDESGSDNKVMESLILSLKEKNYNYYTCNNIDDSIKKIIKEKFDFIILDIMMNYGETYSFESTKGGLETGYQFLKDFKDKKFDNLNINAKIIVYTNYAFEKFKNKIIKEFNVPYIEKPFENEIFKAIKNINNE